MKSAWLKIIQYAIDYENPMVFHEISVRVWATGDSVDKAITEAKHAMHSQKVKKKPPIDEGHLLPQEGKGVKILAKKEIATGVDDEEKSIELSTEKRAVETTQGTLATRHWIYNQWKNKTTAQSTTKCQGRRFRKRKDESTV